MTQPVPSRDPRVVGILAGGGSLPREIAERIVARGDAVHIVAIAGEADGDLSPFPVTSVGWGKIGAMVHALKSAGCTDLIIVGSVSRPDLTALRPDLGFLRNLPAILRIIAAGGDDSVLTRVVRFFEAQGFRVVGPGDVAPELLIGAGALGRIAAAPEAGHDVALGFDAVRALGPFDVGQAVVVTEGRLEAIEGAEGTDAMLERVAVQRRARGRSGEGHLGVLVKRPKPGQELRIDLPAVGPGTLRRALKAGLAGIAVLADGALAAERKLLLELADAGGLFVQGFRDPEQTRPRYEPADWPVAYLGQRAPTQQQRADATKGAGVLAALASRNAANGTVVDHRHVLAVECGEGVPALLARAGSLRQWGRWRSSRHSGVAVLRADALAERSLDDAAAAGLAGVAIVGQPPADVARAAGHADRLGLFLALVTPPAGTL